MQYDSNVNNNYHKFLESSCNCYMISVYAVRFVLMNRLIWDYTGSKCWNACITTAKFICKIPIRALHNKWIVLHLCKRFLELLPKLFMLKVQQKTTDGTQHKSIYYFLELLSSYLFSSVQALSFHLVSCWFLCLSSLINSYVNDILECGHRYIV